MPAARIPDRVPLVKLATRRFPTEAPAEELRWLAQASTAVEVMAAHLRD
jgi:hypothetical protein